MLEARSLTKYYHHNRAVHQVSFTIRPGEILGYLGPNGAGKSTTVKMLTGLIQPSEGRIFYQGRSVYDDFTAFQRRIGYVPEEPHLYPHLTGREYLQLVGRLRGMPRRGLDPRMDEFLRLFGLWSDRHTPLSAYSKGMRQKILLSAALLHNPDVLILDEPFSGLDVTSVLVVRSLLGKLAGQGKMILYSSHVLEVVEKVCSNVLILRKGEVVAYDSISRLQELMRQPSLEGVFAQLAEVEDSDAVADEILEVMTDPARPARPVAENTDAVSDYRRPAAANLWRFLAGIGKDIRHALRALAASPGFTLVALLSLSLGICIATCAFTEMNAMALRSLPAVEKPDELVALQLPASYPGYKRYRAQSDLFSATFAYIAPVPFGVTLAGRTERTWGHLVTPSYFPTLGVHPALGSFFGPDYEQPGAPPAVVISYRFWQERLASDPAVIGKTLRINAQPTAVIGVAPKDFLGASPVLFAADLWMPVTMNPRVAPELAGNVLERRDRALFRVVGRLKPGVTPARAEAELDAVAQQLEQDQGDLARTQKGRRVLLVEGGKLLPLRKQDLPFFTTFMTLVAGLVMLIACANVANMMLARAAGRRKEIAVRLALGAGRARIVRQLLTESVLVAAGAAVPGVLVSAWLMRLLAHVRMPLQIPVAFDMRPDAQVLLLSIALAMLTGLAFGLMPALQASKTDLTPALKEGGNVRVLRHRRLSLRNLLMVSQLAGSLTLLVILGLLSLGIQTTMGIQSGFNPRNLYLISLDPVRDGYSGEQASTFLQKLLDRVQALPSVTAACLTETVPVSLPGRGVRVSTPGAGSRLLISALSHVVGKDYFDTTGIPILVGRAFRKDDEINPTAAVIVSEALVREFWQGQDPLGRSLEIGSDELVPAKILPGSYDYRAGIAGSGRKPFTVVGVARDVAEGLIVQKPRPVVYFPLRAADYSQPAPEGLTLLVRAVPGVDALAAVRREIAALDSRVTPFNARGMPEQIEQFMAPLKSASWTYAVVGIFGLILAAVGLAGMTAYAVTQRNREIGIRMALGARKRNVLGLVMKEGLILVTVGTGLGLAGGWAGSRLLAAMNASVGKVTSTSTSDPLVLFGAPLLLALLALAACYVPARRSMRVDPVVALRQE